MRQDGMPWYACVRHARYPSSRAVRYGSSAGEVAAGVTQAGRQSRRGSSRYLNAHHAAAEVGGRTQRADREAVQYGGAPTQAGRSPARGWLLRRGRCRGAGRQQAARRQ